MVGNEGWNGGHQNTQFGGWFILTFMRLHLFACLLALPLLAQFPQPDGGGFEPGTLPVAWRTGGPNCMEAPDWQVHEYNADFYILRENGCTHYEKPFLYLIFGSGWGH